MDQASNISDKTMEQGAFPKRTRVRSRSGDDVKTRYTIYPTLPLAEITGKQQSTEVSEVKTQIKELIKLCSKYRENKNYIANTQKEIGEWLKQQKIRDEIV